MQEHLIDWCNGNSHIFLPPTDEESELVVRIFAIPHFRQLISAQSQLLGRPVADPFVIASAGVSDGTVVTEETYRPNASRIPNVCEHFDIRCINVQQFIADLGWTF